MPSSDGFQSKAPTSPDVTLSPCPACLDDGGEPTGEKLVQLPSGTWLRQVCESCRGLGKLDGEGMARHRDMTHEQGEPLSQCEDAVAQVRPTTVRPPFDPAEFARESDKKIRAATEAPASDLLGVRPGDQSLDETRDVPGSVPDVQEVETTGANDALGTDAIPFVLISHDELAWLDLGSDAEQLIASVNGVSSLEAVCAAARVTAEEGASLLLTLAEQGVVSFR